MTTSIEERIKTFLQTQTKVADLKAFHGKEPSVSRLTDRPGSCFCARSPDGFEIEALHYSEKDLSSEDWQALYDNHSYICDLIPGHVQKPVGYDVEQQIEIFSAIPAGSKSFWSEIIDSQVDDAAVHKVGQVLGKLHAQSLQKLKAGQGENKLFQRCSKATEAIKSSTFTSPYESSTVPFLVDANTKAKVDTLANIFAEKNEGLIHGALTPENIFVKEGHPVLTDLSRSSAGPLGFDLGTLVAAYMALYHIHMLNPVDNDAHRRIAYKMMDACKTTASSYMEEMKGTLSTAEMESLMSDAAGFAACELIKRSTTMPYPGIEDNASVMTEIRESGIRLLQQYESIHDMGRLLMIGLMLC